jgi:hypothetical protein
VSLVRLGLPVVSGGLRPVGLEATHGAITSPVTRRRLHDGAGCRFELLQCNNVVKG